MQELAAELGVSLTPVKDALTRLEAEALIQIRPRSGTFVSAVSPDDVAEAFDIRCALECLAAEKALARATHEDVADLRGSPWRSPNPATRAHRSAAATRRATSTFTSGSSRSPAAAGWSRCTRASTRTSRSPASTRVTADWKTRLADERREHLEIVAAFEARDAAALVAALRHHILRAADSLVRDLRQRDETSPGHAAPIEASDIP